MTLPRSRFDLTTRRLALFSLAVWCGWALVDPVASVAFRTSLDDPEVRGLTAARWTSQPVFEVAPGPLGPQLQSLFADAYQRWASVPCARSLSQADVRVGEDSPLELGDGRSAIGWVDELPGNSEDALAATELVVEVSDSGESRIVEADIRLSARLTIDELPAVLAHEVGHALGLYHPCDDDRSCDGLGMPVMSPRFSREDLATGLPLSPDDEAGICFLYDRPPGDVVAPLLAGDRCVRGGVRSCAGSLSCASTGYCAQPCSSSSDCPATCADGFCESPLSLLGEPCERGEDCSAGICLLGRGAMGGHCVRECAPVPCPRGYPCQQVEGESVCALPSAQGSACSASDAAVDFGLCSLGFLLLWNLVGRRRPFGVCR